jgi:hypothetical protein
LFLPVNCTRWPIGSAPRCSELRGSNATENMGPVRVARRTHAVRLHKSQRTNGEAKHDRQHPPDTRHRLRPRGRRIRFLGPKLDSRQGPGQRPDAGNRRGHPGRRIGLPRQAVHHHCGGRRRAGHSHRHLPGPRPWASWWARCFRAHAASLA